MNTYDMNYYYLSDTQEAELWKSSTFVFDTSALLQFYYYSNNAKESIFKTLFEILEGRLWVPYNVMFEYQKNRISTINKSYSEKYDPLEKDVLQAIHEIIDSIDPKLGDFQDKTKSTDTHPFIDASIIDKFIAELEKFKQSYSKFDQQVRQQFETRRAEINSMADKDIVLEAISKYFAVGEPFDFNLILEIVAEGELRYRNKIPPGYKDAGDKEGTQKYGDLIIWKQIIDYANQIKTPIILVTNDVKEDWVYVTKQGSEKRIDRPREDLIKEMKDEAKIAFWMYTFSQFLYTAQKQLDTPIDKKVLEEVEQVSIAKQSNTDELSSILSPREIEVLVNVIRGLSNKEIAASLSISHQTVKNHMSSILAKLHVDDRTQAAVTALKNGWVILIDPDEVEGW